MIAIVDYKAGNLTSVKKALDRVSGGAEITGDPAVVERADKIVLPGVGHFSATSTLEKTGLRDVISRCIARGVPFLGICVGLQWMIDSSEESPETRGLGLWPGQCERFPPGVKAPHVGWNQLQIARGTRLFQGIEPGAFVYFTHSYRVPLLSTTVAVCEYGGKFSAAVEKENVFGVQFHPEKSGDAGLQLLDNFCKV